MQNVLKLLKPSGLLVENLSTPAYAADQLMLYKEFLGGVAEETSKLSALCVSHFARCFQGCKCQNPPCQTAWQGAGNHILFGRSQAVRQTIEQ